MLSEPLTAILSPEETAASTLMLEQLAVDVTRTYQFWEAAMARLTGGALTPHGCPWDLELPYLAGPVRIEVKYAQESWCQFRSGKRLIFKFAAPKGRATEKAAHVIALVGIDQEQNVHTWVAPARAVRKCASITLTSPRFRTGASRSRGLDAFRCPPTQALPEVLRAYRQHVGHDCRDHHRETAAATRRAAAEQAGQLTIAFPPA